MSFAQENLLPNEHIIFTAKRHWIIFTLAVGLTVFALAVASTYATYSIPTYLVSIIAVMEWISSMITYKTSEYVLTNQRILIKIGFIQRQSLETLLQRIASIEVSQSILGRLLGYGTVIIHDTGGSKEGFNSIDDPIRLRKKIQQQIEASIKK